MNDLIFLFFRRMRAPLLVLIGAYAISMAGLVLIPGTDPVGNPWRMSFFHAFYFVSFMGSTIGFGEIPYPFNDAQRLWTSVAIYLCVVSWLYAIGSILTLAQEPAFRRVVAEQRFTDRVRRLVDPFYLICGYGETGNLLVNALRQRGLRSVIVDADERSVSQLLLGSQGIDVPALQADAREVHHLIEAGLKHPSCRATIALTNDEDVNVKIAITSKLLRPPLPVICRANTKATAANLASFNTDYIINPFQVFAEHLALALRSPGAHLLHNWLIGREGKPLPKPIEPPRGTWIICGFGRFGKEVRRYLDYEGIPTVVIEPDPAQAPEGAVLGRGTEAITLREAGIDQAVGLVAGADQDINNLSIVMTAKDMNPDLYIVARQNRRANDEIFRAAGIDLVMESSRILVMRILPLLTTPLLNRFLRQVRQNQQECVAPALERLRQACRRYTPRTWSITIDPADAPALHAALLAQRQIRLGDLLRADDRETAVNDVVVLMMRRGGADIVLPEADERLQIGDELLLSAPREAAAQLEWRANNHKALDYALTGRLYHDSFLWRWLARHGWVAAQRSAPPPQAGQNGR